jgi:DNA-directed RNA polymerase subunit beta'
MAVHVPLTVEAQAEARFLMLSVNNILAPKDGTPITTPTQDMILGSYYLTHPGERDKAPVPLSKKSKEESNNPIKIAIKGKDKATTWWRDGAYEPETVQTKTGETVICDGRSFADFSELMMAYQSGSVTLHSKVRVRIFAGAGDKRGRLIDSTVGRFIFNEHIPQNLGMVEDREVDPYSLEVDQLCDKKVLGRIIDECFRKNGNTETAIMLDHIKDLGFHYSTVAAVTISISDMEIPQLKEQIITEAEKTVADYEDMYQQGLIDQEERYNYVVKTWNDATDKVADALMDSLGELNNLYIMANSGARGSKSQIRQIGGMRGLMANATGRTIEIPIKANFREGLSVLEYFISSNGARKGLADTALRTAESGYLTRRLVDVSHNVIVRESDCWEHTPEEERSGIAVSKFMHGKETIEELRQRIVGRTAFEDIVNPITGELIVAANDEIDEEAARLIDEVNKAATDKEQRIEEVRIRSMLTCHTKDGICAKCYGRNLATGDLVNIGEAVGIQAAQSIGEPGTQLTMRTFHTGGVAAGGDITQGLPRVEELFEARKPAGLARVCEENGYIEDIKEKGGVRTIIVSPDPDDAIADDGIPKEARKYEIPASAGRVIVEKGGYVEAGDALTQGPLDPKQVLQMKGEKGVYDYLLKEVQRVYKLQGVDINDKHIEIIVSQMLSKFKVVDAGDTNLLPDKNYTKDEIEAANALLEEGQAEVIYERVLQGITKASLATDSFLSAASFQETTKILTGAAIEGKTDKLFGLKENVIIGKLIPAGTGMPLYNEVDIDYGENAEYMEDFGKDDFFESSQDSHLSGGLDMLMRIDDDDEGMMSISTEE